MSEDNGTTAFDPEKARAALALIAKDMADGARSADGRPVDGRVLGEYFGNQSAAIKRLAEIVSALLLKLSPQAPDVAQEHVSRATLADTGEVSAYLRVPPRTLDTWAYAGSGPKFSKVGKHRRYRWEDVDRWLDTQSGAADDEAVSA